MFRSAMSLDSVNRTLTLVAGGITVVAVGVASAVGPRAAWPAVPILGVVLSLAWAMAPCAVAIDGGELLIERRAWSPLRITRSTIASAEPLDRLGTRPLRLFGVGGFFGSYGLFSSRELGRFRLYARRRGQAVLVRRRGDELPLVLTPDDVAGTIAAIDPR
ncbi:MAG TPA: PH domain-containing protein [Polyangiaceae bacterium]|jgi:hypothetical protein